MFSSQIQFSSNRRFSIIYANLKKDCIPKPTVEIKQKKIDEDSCTNLMKASIEPNQILFIETNDLTIDNGYGNTMSRIWRDIDEHNRIFDTVFLTIDIKKDYTIPTHCDIFYFLSFFNIRKLVFVLKTETKNIMLCKVISESVTEYIERRMVLLKGDNKTQLLNELDNDGKIRGCMEFLMIDENVIFKLNDLYPKHSTTIIRQRPISFKIEKKTNGKKIYPSLSSKKTCPKDIFKITTTTTTIYYLEN